MNTLRLRRTLFVVAVVALAVTAMPLAAAPAIDGPVADVLLGTTQVQWSPRAEYAGLRLTISGPNGTEQFAFGPGESPLLDLASVVADIDGQYSWELRAVPNVDVQQIAAAMRTPGFAGGERQRPAGLPAAEDLVQSGSFRVVGGAIVQPMAEAPAALNVEGAGGGNKVTGDLGFVTAELLHAEDVKIQGSLCVGFDCTNSESFGFDTIRLKENNLRITFVDTSNSASFPTNDWRIEANSSANGGGSYFAIIDVDGGRTPFQIDAGAPTNSLRVDSGGDLGLGVSNPVVELHVADGDTPTLRLEQNNSSGFTAQTWDVAGNETNFFVRDATNGSALPFRIFPGSGADDALIIASDGDIGMGSTTPDASLDIERATDPSLRLTDTGGEAWDIRVTGGGNLAYESAGTATNFLLNNNGRITVNSDTSGGLTFDLGNTGDLTIAGDYFSATCTSPSNPCTPDYVFAPDYQLMPLAELEEFIQANQHLPNIPSADDVVKAGRVNMSQFQMQLLEKIEELTLYTLSQQDEIETQREEIEGLRAELAELSVN